MERESAWTHSTSDIDSETAYKRPAERHEGSALDSRRSLKRARTDDDFTVRERARFSSDPRLRAREDATAVTPRRTSFPPPSSRRNAESAPATVVSDHPHHKQHIHTAQCIDTHPAIDRKYPLSPCSRSPEYSLQEQDVNDVEKSKGES